MTQAELMRFEALADAAVERVAELTQHVCSIPAPTGQEAERASFVAAALRQRGLEPDIDEIGNVVARRPGHASAGGQAVPSLMLAAHTDTVFPAGTALDLRREGDRLHGPGIGDNSVSVAAMIVLAELLDEAELRTPGDLLLVADVGEEGLGNLCGIRAVVDRFEHELGAVIALEGHGLGRITRQAVGSRRIRVTVTGPGGHSFGQFGRPSATHALGSIIHRISQLTVPHSPKTTYNVGLIEGGTSVNTIAPTASAVIDMRDRPRRPCNAERADRGDLPRTGAAPHADQ